MHAMKGILETAQCGVFFFETVVETAVAVAAAAGLTFGLAKKFRGKRKGASTGQ